MTDTPVTSRNGWTRRIGVPECVIRFLHEQGVTANMATGAGLIAGLATEAYYYLQPPTSRAARVRRALFSTAIRALDSVDGSLARLERKPGEPPSKFGANIDMCTDKALSFAYHMLQALDQRRRGNKLGYYVSVFAGVSSMLPALTRAQCEMNGVIVPENGKGLGFLGTQVGRSVAASVTDLLGPNAVPALNTLLMSQNISTSWSRYWLSRSEDAPKTLAPHDIEIAKMKKELLFGLLGGAAVASIATTLHGRQKKN